MTKKKKDVEFIRQSSSDKKCYNCAGTGVMEKEKPCNRCDATGTFVDNHYIMIAGGLAFSVDGGK